MTTAVARPGRAAAPARSSGAAYVVFFVVVGMLFGGLTGFPAPRYAAGATLVFTGLEGPERAGLYQAGRYTLDRLDTWAEVAESDAVADVAAARAGRPIGALRGAISAVNLQARAHLELTVTAPAPDLAVRWAEAAAAATVDTITAQETLPGFTPRVRVTIASVDGVAQDTRWPEIRLGALLGGVLGLLAGWLFVSIRRPGRWSEGLAPALDGPGQDDEVRRIDQQVQIEVLGALLLGQSARGVLVAAAVLFGIFGYALTGSPIPPLLVVLAAGVAGWKDLRFAAGGILFAGVYVLPGRIEIVEVGSITPTVLEVAIGIGVVLVLLGRRPGGPRGVFTGPVLAVLAAMVVGAFVGTLNGAEFTDVIGPARSIFALLAFFVVREAFRGRAYQLFAILVVTAAAASAIGLMAVPLDLDLILGQSRGFVLTGDTTTDVTRLGTPVLALWSPLLVILAAGVIRLRPPWLWALLLIPCLALQALSFNRSTWVSLLVLAVVVAVLRGGRRGLLNRAGAVLVIGAIGVGALGAGVFGTEGQVIALRFTSVLTGDALAEDSLPDRLRENEFAWERLTESPVTGTGIGVPYGREDFRYDEVRNVLTFTDRPWIHNQYLRVWLWMGALGLVAYGWVGVRLFALSVFDRARRGRASTVTVAGAAGLAAIAAQAVFQTSLDHLPTIITVGVLLALIELAAAPPGTDRHHRIPVQRGSVGEWANG